MEVLWRGAFGMDAKRGTMGQGWPTVTTLGTAPERGKFRAAKPGCRVRFLFGYFLFRASKEKVTRRKGETGSSQARNTLLVQCLAKAALLASAQSRRLNRACS